MVSSSPNSYVISASAKISTDVVELDINGVSSSSELRIKSVDRNLKTTFITGAGDSYYTAPNRTGITATAYGIVELRVNP